MGEMRSSTLEDEAQEASAALAHSATSDARRRRARGGT
jgi:hypothetical protein